MPLERGRITLPFTDDTTGEVCKLVIPQHGRVFPAAGQPKIGISHGGCGTLADLCAELDAFWCPDCHRNGRVSGAWAHDQIKAMRLGLP